MGMSFESSNATRKSYVRPLIRKGYYAGKLLAVKEPKRADGSLVENKYGKQIVLEFAIHKLDQDTNTVGEPVTFKPTDKDTNDVILPMFLNSEWKETEKGGAPKLGSDGKQLYRSAFSPDSRITKVFKSLGWAGPPGRIDVESFIGRWVEVNVNDYTPAPKDGVVQPTASGIQGVAEFNGKVPDSIRQVQAPTAAPAQEEPLQATEEAVESTVALPVDLQEKNETLLQQLHDGLLTDRGYEIALENLRAEAKARGK